MHNACVVPSDLSLQGWRQLSTVTMQNQPPTLPRPDVKALGISYRRIPLMSIGRDVYLDSRLILHKLEKKFPDGALGATEPEQKGLEKLLEKWTIEAGVFNRAAQLIPTDMPLLRDPKFARDREDFSGRSWDSKDMAKMRPEAVAHVREAFALMETTLLADGREWILKTDKPSLADIEGEICMASLQSRRPLMQSPAIWVFDWLHGLKGALPREIIGERQYPKTFAWVDRFRIVVAAAGASAPKPATLKGDDALQRITSAEFSEPEGQVDGNDPSGLQKGQQVEIWPIDSGFRHHDVGTLVAMDETEIVLSTQSSSGGQEIRIHCPRTNFRIQAVQTSTSSRL